MSKRSNNRRNGLQNRGESPQSEALTVFWTLNVLGASFGLLVCFALKVITVVAGVAGMVDQIMAVLVFSAGLTSMLAMVTYPMLVRLRNRQLPRGIVLYAAIICVAALGMSLWV